MSFGFFSRFFKGSKSAISGNASDGVAEDAHKEALKRIRTCWENRETRLDLSDMGLSILPPEIGQLPDLKTLYLGGNRLTTLPPEIGQLRDLQTLNLVRNRLTTLPPEIGQLRDLLTLYLGSNRLTTLPPVISQLTKLCHLDIPSNELTMLPPEIGNLTQLAILDLSRNQLTTLPPEIGKLVDLKLLFLAQNRLSSLPPELGQLSSLETLAAYENQLAALPPKIAGLTRLKDLDLDHNRLASLPTEMSNLESLSQLGLHDNPNLGIPDSILDLTRPEDILNFYFAQRQAAAAGTLQPLNEIKVMLLGDGGAGKTSLRRFFKGEAHSHQEPETLGIALDTFTLNFGPTDITVRLWDFAGQEITHALHQFFLTEGCFYVIVLEPRSDNEQSDAENWLKLIERFAKSAPALVVLNKQDTRKPSGYDVDRNLLRERFPFIRDFQPTTCGRVRKGCDELLNTLRDAVVSTPQARPWVPESWIKVKDECFEQGGDGKEAQYLTLEEFRSLCARHGEPDKDKQESLARILHNLGAVLHFVDEPRLRDTAVLNPHWVTDGAYRLLRFKDRPNSDGVLTLREALEAMPSADEATVRYLLNLMERFEMCFPLDADQEGVKSAERWLVPGSLNKNQPDQIQIADWKDAERVRLRYAYDPLPQGLIPRFIVMTHPISEGQPRWRNGVVLDDEKAHALIRRDPRNDNLLEVIVQGPQPARDKLVKVIRGYLARIHGDLPDPKPKEWQELEGMPEEFREIRQMKADERRDIPLVVETKGGDLEKNPTTELNRSSDEGPRRSNRRPLRVFLSYSHDDRREQTHFRKNLIALQNDGYITFWDDPNIHPGMEWRSEIDRELEAMDIFIGLLTTNFRTSTFIQRVEFKEAMQRRKDKTAEMWLILVEKDCRIEGTDYEGIQVLKPGGKAVKDGRSLRDGFNVAEKELFPLVKVLWEKQPETDQLSRPEA